jgi:hypothetical protein
MGEKSRPISNREASFFAMAEIHIYIGRAFEMVRKQTDRPRKI